MNEEQIQEQMRAALKGINVPTAFLQVVSGIVWETTVTAEVRVERIQRLLQEAGDASID